LATVLLFHQLDLAPMMIVGSGQASSGMIARWEVRLGQQAPLHQTRTSPLLDVGDCLAVEGIMMKAQSKNQEKLMFDLCRCSYICSTISFDLGAMMGRWLRSDLVRHDSSVVGIGSALLATGLSIRRPLHPTRTRPGGGRRLRSGCGRHDSTVAESGLAAFWPAPSARSRSDDGRRLRCGLVRRDSSVVGIGSAPLATGLSIRRPLHPTRTRPGGGRRLRSGRGRHDSTVADAGLAAFGQLPQLDLAPMMVVGSGPASSGMIARS